MKYERNNLVKKTIIIGLILVLMGTSISTSIANFPEATTTDMSSSIANFPEATINVTFDERPQFPPDINFTDLYYLMKSDPPEFPFKANDEGYLLTEMPTAPNVIYCSEWVQLTFNESGQPHYSGVNKIYNIYSHIWYKTPNPKDPGYYPYIELGYSTSKYHNRQVNELITINTENCVTQVDNFNLVKTMLHTNPDIASFEGDDIYNLTVKILGDFPRVRSNPNQYSYIIVNVPNASTLKSSGLYGNNTDTDDDGLSDYDELYVSITNPLDSDTDDDGVSDYQEKIMGSDPNDFLSIP